MEYGSHLEHGSRMQRLKIVGKSDVCRGVRRAWAAGSMALHERIGVIVGVL